MRVRPRRRTPPATLGHIDVGPGSAHRRCRTGLRWPRLPAPARGPPPRPCRSRRMAGRGGPADLGIIRYRRIEPLRRRRVGGAFHGHRLIIRPPVKWGICASGSRRGRTAHRFRWGPAFYVSENGRSRRRVRAGPAGWCGTGWQASSTVSAPGWWARETNSLTGVNARSRGMMGGAKRL